MDKGTTPDEKPKRRVAKQVISEKRMYFVPAQGVSVEAGSIQEAVNLAKKAVSKEETGDAKQ